MKMGEIWIRKSGNKEKLKIITFEYWGYVLMVYFVYLNDGKITSLDSEYFLTYFEKQEI